MRYVILTSLRNLELKLIKDFNEKKSPYYMCDKNKHFTKVYHFKKAINLKTNSDK